MTRQEYEDKKDVLYREIAKLTREKDEISKSSLTGDELSGALEAVEKELSALRTEKFSLEDEYNYQEEQKKSEFNAVRDEKILQTEISAYGKRQKIIEDYMKKFPHSQYTKDILDGKEVKLSLLINELKKINIDDESILEEDNSVKKEEVSENKDNSPETKSDDGLSLNEISNKLGVPEDKLVEVAEHKKKKMESEKEEVKIKDPLDEEEIKREEDGSRYTGKIRGKLKKHWKKIVAGIVAGAIAVGLFVGAHHMEANKAKDSKEALAAGNKITSEQTYNNESNQSGPGNIANDEKTKVEDPIVNETNNEIDKNSVDFRVVYSSADDLVNETNPEQPNKEYYRTDNQSVMGYIDQSANVHPASGYKNIPADAVGVLTGASGGVDDNGVVRPGEYSGFAPIKNGGRNK